MRYTLDKDLPKEFCNAPICFNNNNITADLPSVVVGLMRFHYIHCLYITLVIEFSHIVIDTDVPVTT
jgi:hypothetical protein